jgi:hypothetical protein
MCAQEANALCGSLCEPPAEAECEATFQLISSVALYGGFPSGGGTWNERDPNTHETILSGDLNTDDGGWGRGTATAADNCADAEPVYAGFTYRCRTMNATKDGSSSACPNMVDVWYKYTPVADGNLAVTGLCPSIHTGCPGTASNESGQTEHFFRASSRVLAGNTYYIRLLAGVLTKAE